jgi:signal transduction histidine kinase
VDDGAGLPNPHHAGVGLASMRERAEELGGTCFINSRQPNGVQVMAQFPSG